MKPVGKLTKVGGGSIAIPIVYQTNIPVPGPKGDTGPPGPPGEMGLDGVSPSAGDVVQVLRNDLEFLNNLLKKKKLVFSVERDELGLITNFTITSELEDEA